MFVTWGGITANSFDQLRPYHFRLRFEAWLNSFFFSTSIVLIISIVMAVLTNLVPGILTVEEQLTVLFIAFVFIFFLSFYFLYRPSWKKLGLRIDALGLEERISTFVEFAHQNSIVYEFQRQDALDALQTISPRQLTIYWPKKWILISGLLAVVLIGLQLIPTSFWKLNMSMNQAVQTNESNELKDVQAKLETISEMIANASIPEESKDILYERLWKIESLIMSDTKINLYTLTQIMRDTEQLLKDVQALTTLSPIIDELKKTTLLKELAVAISTRVEARIREAMNGLEIRFLAVEDQSRASLLIQAAEEIENALYNVPGGMEATMSSDYLCYCFKWFASELRYIATIISVGISSDDAVIDAVHNMQNRLILMLSAEKNAEKGFNLSDGSAMEEEEGTTTIKVYGQASGSAAGVGTMTASQIAQMIQDGMLDIEEVEQEHFQNTDMVYEPTLDAAFVTGTYVPGKKNKDGSIQREVVDPKEKLSGTIEYEKVYGMYYADALDLLVNTEGIEHDRLENYFNSMLQSTDSRTRDE